jgi:hypothetical protein
MNAHEYTNNRLKLDQTNPYVPIKEEIIAMVDEENDAIDNEPIDEVVNLHIGDVVVD